MPKQSRNDAALPAAILAALALAVLVPVALAAAPAAPSGAAVSARPHGGSTEARATLELYALEARLARARGTLAALTARRAEVERLRAATERQLEVARGAARTSEARLGALVRALYEQSGATEPLEVVLGAESVDEALAALDGLARAAGHTAEIAEQARASRARLSSVQVRLARRAAELRELAAAAESEASELAATAAERARYLAALRRRQELDAVRIAAAQEQASAAATRTVAASPAPAAVAAAPVPAEAPAAPAAPAGTRAGRTLTVTSTGYVLRGLTATGIPTAPGVVAVDPDVIPLGTRMYVPGYGEGVAADTGGAVVGNTIDLWFPTLADAHRWGRRTVTITLR